MFIVLVIAEPEALASTQRRAAGDRRAAAVGIGGGERPGAPLHGQGKGRAAVPLLIAPLIVFVPALVPDRFSVVTPMLAPEVIAPPKFSVAVAVVVLLMKLYELVDAPAFLPAPAGR